MLQPKHPQLQALKPNKLTFSSVSMKNKLRLLVLFLYASCLLFSLCSPIIAQETFPFVAAIKAKNVNVRSGPSKNFEKVAELKQGEGVVIVAKSYSWYEIKLPYFAKSFISKQYIQMLGGGIGRVTGNRVNIRAGADVKCSVLGQAKKDEWVKVVGTKGEWFQIEPIDQSYGYVLAEFCEFRSEKVPPPRVVPPPTRNRYELKRRQDEEEQRRNALESRAAPELDLKKPEKKPIIRYKMVGVIEAMGQEAISGDIRHKLLVGGQTKCYLRGYRGIIDSFLNLRVMIEGEMQKDIEAAYPVMMVTKINLIL